VKDTIIVAQNMWNQYYAMQHLKHQKNTKGKLNAEKGYVSTRRVEEMDGWKSNGKVKENEWIIWKNSDSIQIQLIDS
jgi:hypothetical protein